MKQTTMQTISIALLAITVFVCSTSALIAAWWTWGPVPQYFKPTMLEAHSVRYENGDLIVTRSAAVRKGLRMTITRDIRLVDMQRRYGLSMAPLELHSNGNDGAHTFERRFQIPYKLPPGEYELRSTVEWQANPMRVVATELPIVRFQVP